MVLGIAGELPVPVLSEQHLKCVQAIGMITGSDSLVRRGHSLVTLLPDDSRLRHARLSKVSVADQRSMCRVGK